MDVDSAMNALQLIYDMISEIKMFKKLFFAPSISRKSTQHLWENLRKYKLTSVEEML